MNCRRIAGIVMILAVAAALAACGRKGDVRAPPGAEDSDYPRRYPSAAVP